jgi:hypothetical protein
MTSKITEEIVEMLRSRSDVGLKKYGVSMDRTDLTHADWCLHAIEEMLDGAQYLLQVKNQVPLKTISVTQFVTLAEGDGPWSFETTTVTRNLYEKLVKEGYITGDDYAE